MIRPTRGTIVAACLSTWAFATAPAHADDTEPLHFYCGKTFITVHRTHVFDGQKTLDSSGFLTIRKADVDYVNLWTVDGTTHLHIGMKGEEGRPTFVPKSFHRAIVECLD